MRTNLRGVVYLAVLVAGFSFLSPSIVFAEPVDEAENVVVDTAEETIDVSVGAVLDAVVPSSGVPSTNLITPDVVASIREFVDTDIVRLSILNQNKKYASLQQADVDGLDQQWRAETKAAVQPLISATLSNPLSAYLTRVQAQSVGLFSEIFVMDDKGLNVGQSNISSDYWQGDEAKFQKTFPVSGAAVFIDEAELHDDTQTWRAQVNLSITDGNTDDAIGAITVEVNLTELQRRKAAGVL